MKSLLLFFGVKETTQGGRYETITNYEINAT